MGFGLKMNRFKDYDVKLVEYPSYDELYYKGETLAKVAKNGKVIYTYHSNMLQFKEGTELLRLLKKGKVERWLR